MNHFQKIFRKNDFNYCRKMQFKNANYVDVALNVLYQLHKPCHKAISEIE